MKNLKELEVYIQYVAGLTKKLVESVATQQDDRGPRWEPKASVFSNPVALAQFYSSGTTLFREMERKLAEFPQFHNKIYIEEKLGIAWDAFEEICGTSLGKVPNNDPKEMGDQVQTFENKYSYVLDNLGKLHCTSLAGISTSCAGSWVARKGISPA